MDDFYKYITERNSMGGCNINKWDCEKYLDCDICLQDKIIELEKKIKTDAIDDVFNFLKTKRDKKYMKVNLDDIEIKDYKEQLKAGVENGKHM